MIGWLLLLLAILLAVLLGIGLSIENQCRKSWELEKPTTQQCFEYGYPAKSKSGDN